MDRDLEKGDADSETPQESNNHDDNNNNNNNFESGQEKAAHLIYEHHVQIQDFAPTPPSPPRSSSPVYGYYRASVEDLPEGDDNSTHDDYPSQSPVYESRWSLNNGLDTTGNDKPEGSPRSPSPVYGLRASSESTGDDDAKFNDDHASRPPSPIFGLRPSLDYTDDHDTARNGSQDGAGALRPSIPVYNQPLAGEPYEMPRPGVTGTSAAVTDTASHPLPQARHRMEAHQDSGTSADFDSSRATTGIASDPIKTSFMQPPHLPSPRPLRLPEPEPLDFSWIIRHHNNELVAPIRLQQPSQLTQILESVKVWRPWPWKSKHRRQTSKPDRGDKNQGWERPDPEASYRISIAELHRIRLRKLQLKLVHHAWYMKRFNAEPPPSVSTATTTPHSPTAGGQGGTGSVTTTKTTWEDDLKEYTQALQDYDYMTKCSSLPRDSFLVSGERKVDDYVMRERVGISLSSSSSSPASFEKAIPVVGPWETDSQPIGGTRNENVQKSWLKSFERRLVMAVLGGTFLVGPMWLMVLVNTKWTALVSTTAFVYAFGGLMSLMLEKPMEVLSGTAAYAAVLVVFVGLGLESQGGGSGKGGVVNGTVAVATTVAAAAVTGRAIGAG